MEFFSSQNPFYLKMDFSLYHFPFAPNFADLIWMDGKLWLDQIY